MQVDPYETSASRKGKEKEKPTSTSTDAIPGVGSASSAPTVVCRNRILSHVDRAQIRAIDKTNKFTKLQIQSMFGINPRALARALENNLKGSHKGDPENDDNLLSDEFKAALATEKFTKIKQFVVASIEDQERAKEIEPSPKRDDQDKGLGPRSLIVAMTYLQEPHFSSDCLSWRFSSDEESDDAQRTQANTNNSANQGDDVPPTSNVLKNAQKSSRYPSKRGISSIDLPDGADGSSKPQNMASSGSKTGHQLPVRRRKINIDLGLLLTSDSDDDPWDSNIPTASASGLSAMPTSGTTTAGESLAPTAVNTGPTASSAGPPVAHAEESLATEVPIPSRRPISPNPPSSSSTSKTHSQAASGPSLRSTPYIKPDPDQIIFPAAAIVPKPEPRDPTPEIEELPAPSNANALSIRTFLSTFQPPLTQYAATFEKLGVKNAEDLLILKGLSPASVREFLQEVRKETNMTFLQSLAFINGPEQYSP
ncbi:hypothetical protein FRB90_002283 [Tulasnella sp. 427]|nr:hypothetical protein FRB90_002283 [Tulasnella sp. 427]